MATVVRSKFADILTAVQTQLRSSTSFPAARCFMSIREPMQQEWIGQGDQFIVIRPRGSNANRPIEIGAGRIDTRATRRFSVILRTRLEIDEENKAPEWLTNATYGHLVTEHAIFDALQDFQPLDSSSNWLACEPIKFVACGQPDEDRTMTGWGFSVSEWDVTHVLDLSQSYQ